MGWTPHSNTCLARSQRVKHVLTAAGALVSRWWVLGLIAFWISSTGAGCPHIMRQYTQPIPRALPEAASLTQIIDVVNDNSSRVQSVSTTRATISTPGMPSLNANIAFERPRSFRLVGEKFGPRVDIGSNNELMWFWAQQEPPAMYFVRHTQFQASAARQIMPVEPEWLIEAFGIVTFDPAVPPQGPQPVGSGRVQLRRRVGPPGQETERVTVIDDTRGIVLEQHVYDARGGLLASAVLSKHARDPASGATLPRHVNLSWPASKLELSIDLNDLQINQLPADSATLFTKPVYSGYNDVDLALPNPNQLPAVNGQAQPPQPARY